MLVWFANPQHASEAVFCLAQSSQPSNRTVRERGYTLLMPCDSSLSRCDLQGRANRLHATMLHLLGVEHKKLTYKFQGRDFRLTDVHGTVVKKILA